MSSGQLKVHRPKSRTIIKDGMIVRMNKNGTVKSVLGPYVVNHKKK